jgi:CRP/FNR family transcriptional regulator, cyclic AMP receptor protein
MGLAPIEGHEALRPAMPRRPATVTMVPLLDLDPDLGALLTDQRRAAARAELMVRQLRLGRGEWAGGRLGPVSREHVGLLVVEGALAREVVLADTISTELIGPGDVLRPWSPPDTPRLLGQLVRWQVLADARLAVLNRAFGVGVLRFPEINTVLLDRLNDRAERLSTMKAIAQLNTVERRLLALFWHLAERWGRMTAEGVVVPLTLSHRLLGELVGARRPTVSTALAALARERKLLRRSGGDWLLAQEPESTPASRCEHAVSHRRRLLTEHPPRRESRASRAAAADSTPLRA